MREKGRSCAGALPPPAALSSALWTARGCKPGFLWDVSEPTDRAVADCLKLCNTSGDVRALRLGRDVVLCNIPEALRRLADGHLPPKFVDVSAKLRSPRVLVMLPPGVADMLSSLRRRLVEAASSPTFRDSVFADIVPADGGWNLCTAFGVLLGYPVVYWFNGGADAGNCLAMEELNVVRVRGAGRTPTEWDDVYSFSFPLTLGVELKPHVDAWWEQLRARTRSFELTRPRRCCDGVIAVRPSDRDALAGGSWKPDFGKNCPVSALVLRLKPHSIYGEEMQLPEETRVESKEERGCESGT